MGKGGGKTSKRLKQTGAIIEACTSGSQHSTPRTSSRGRVRCGLRIWGEGVACWRTARHRGAAACLLGSCVSERGLPLVRWQQISEYKKHLRERAERAALQRVLDRLDALGSALLRTETVRDAGRSFAEMLPADPPGQERLFERLPADVRALQQNALLQAGNLMMVHLGLLYAVIEAWSKWHFTDARVDELLKAPFLEDLRAFRNAIFHVSVATEARVLRWGAESDRIVWSQDVERALRGAILDWGANLTERTTQHPRAMER